MRNAASIAIAPRSARWAEVAAQWDQFFSYLCHDGAGVDLAEVNGAADSEDYTGTGATLWGTPSVGVIPDGDGGWPLPSTVNAAFEWDVPMVFGFSVWLSAADDNAAASQGTILSVGSDSTGAANEPAAGHWRFRTASTGSQLNPAHIYRDGVNDDAAGAVPTVDTVTHSSVAITASAYAQRRCYQLLIENDGAALAYTFFADGVEVDSGTYSVDGHRRLNAMRPREATIDGLVRIGNNINGLDPAVAERAAWQAGSAADGIAIEALTFFRSESKTAAEATALLSALYKFRAEAPV